MASDWGGEEFKPSLIDRVDNVVSWIASVSGFIVCALVFIYLWSR